MTAREIALVHLRRWMTSAETLPTGATLLEPMPMIAPTSCWAIRHPRTGALLGWHAEPARLALLYWDTLAADDRYEVVAEAAGALEKETHRFAWKQAWHHWTRNAGVKSRAVERAVTAWLRRNRRDLEAALCATRWFRKRPSVPRRVVGTAVDSTGGRSQPPSPPCTRNAKLWIRLAARARPE